MRLPLALAAVAAMIGFAAPVHAHTDQDAVFLNALANAGIAVPDPAAAIASAQAVCGLMRNGETGLQVLTDVKKQNPALTLDGAALFTAIASNSYCPEHLGHSEGGYF
ncbi:hypothetical protein BST27_07250 [Mycobacterium intermedium]|uniref:DUF732 domain-containing protein n=1 Tax=Mycobacterium intermedium TaxID=28445 RepID=A0A1E3SID4_MYCIE|nr:DUF732 domain-containing protein [Mycobacterium intermedium]MCV6964398.1 DUF732 domain-containing protein [Mycobacterium intermedium]ODR01881.1 hypothetical protein BHQ20_07115 [Mycobacterium intermedium]OPE49493.1 hypothetical protein BV508_13945 [Mycobacterium intermedium]ORB08611.1 hypothetical protein BST27_07250 [Mycobacterium intermedium]